MEVRGAWVHFPVGVTFCFWIFLFSRDSVECTEYISIEEKLDWNFSIHLEMTLIFTAFQADGHHFCSNKPDNYFPVYWINSHIIQIV